MVSIDPILQQILEAVPFRLSPDDGPAAARKALRDLPRPPLHPEVRAEDRAVDSPAGPIPIRIYWPPGHSGPAPVVLFVHGGGFAAGDLETHDGTARQHAVGADAVVVAVDYRLAPEHPYPAAVDDVWVVLRWIAAHAAEFGGDPRRLAVAGDSAGGNLAAVLAQLARDAGAPQLRFQLLWYPAITWDTSLASYTENAAAPILDLAAITAFSDWYAPDLARTDPAGLPATLAPSRAESLAGLPPAHIAVAGHDPLRDDGVVYGELLSQAGVAVTVDHAESLIHGYLGYAGFAPAATEALDRGLAALRSALHA
ncbi:alpha/beta hydrolase [[Mycobacterium] burgundiense]|uniref:Alpha/beta hydrolase n=1 Tax=[Mycobacterium] burgundiense TaxID=3064286 RepID=A0ABM9LU37_9MYCO|nr:alpha/beta hydrolase [Mycolicibacterium sp. MU0053]CAJ1504713.1 alpha/beta hydrolase [Mycolicibacterium sp. MU0053]